MRAVRIHEYGGPEVLVCEEIDRPSPGPGQVLVRILAASVNPIDVAVREDRFPTPRTPPKTIGSDGAGVVEALGSDVHGVAIGDEVLFTGLGVGSEGSYAEYALIAEAQAVPKPAELSFPEAAAFGLAFATAYYALVRRAALRPGETILIQGAAGGVGTASVQLAKALGARVIASVGGSDDAAFVRGLGADETIDYKTEDVAARARELSGGDGVNVVHELHVSANLETDLRAIARGGRIVATGQGPRPEVSIPIGAALSVDASLLFMSTSNAGRAGVAEILGEVSKLVAEGRVKPVIGGTFTLEEARAAHEALAGHHQGKIVLLP
jgi:NADPH2:quinone reductase